jgi:hypothetical protein
MLCCNKNRNNKIEELIIELKELDDFQKKILINRYVNQVNFYTKKSSRYGCLYYLLNMVITIGSILLPALLAIQNNETYKEQIYWLAWFVSLIITISNGVIQLYKVNSLYIIYNHVKEKLITEGWRYFQLSGKYKNKTHILAFKDFCFRIEELKIKQIEKELEDIGNDNNEEEKLLSPPSEISLIPVVNNNEVDINKVNNETIDTTRVNNETIDTTRVNNETAL